MAWHGAQHHTGWPGFFKPGTCSSNNISVLWHVLAGQQEGIKVSLQQP